MNSADVRKTFLDYFQRHDHAVLPSSSSIPHGDPTLMFTNAGMVQFKDIFTGRQAAPTPPRATTSQKCVRAGGKHNDLDNVGYTTRHLTFFEMLGNFSFGDYFKEEAIAYAWELITKGYGLSSDRLWATVFREDDEAWDLWKRISGLPDDRIVRLGEKDNYWSMGDVGPCGPCSEILLDRGDAFGEADVENGERFFEIWNLVFMQFDQAPDGTKSPLPHPSIDTGMGLERMAMVMQGADTVFETDILRSIVRKVEDLTGVPYDVGDKGVPHRVLADHARSLVYCLADGAEISNEKRGYVVRRILRRAARYGRKLTDEGTIVHRLVDTVVDEMGEAYPEIVADKERIARQIRLEEERFDRTLDRGIELFDEVAAQLKGKGESTVPGDAIFKLHTTYGFPPDLVERMSDEAGLGADMAGYEDLMKGHATTSGAGASFSAATSSLEDAGVEALPETCFVGYERLDGEGEVQKVVRDEAAIHVVLSDTPFYGESGGQVGDTGLLTCGGVQFRVDDTQKRGGQLVHTGEVVDGDPDALREGLVVSAQVDGERRRAIQRNHTATHLLHAALRKVLGTHVRQKGSLVESARLRFDVTHESGIQADELAAAQELVAEHVLLNLPVGIGEMDRDEAIEQGAMAFFGEKYGDRVRVVRIGDFSVELCGGCHVGSTGEIGPFVLLREGSVSAGIRRVEALSGMGAETFHREQAALLDQLSRKLKVAPDRLLERIGKLLEENRELKQRGSKAAAEGGDGEVRKEAVGDVTLVTALYDGIDGKSLRSTWDQFKQQAPKLVAVLVSRLEGKVQVIVGLSRALVDDGWKAADVFQAGAELLQARGGGRPEMVQAGGKAPQGAADAIAAMAAKVRELAG